MAMHEVLEEEKEEEEEEECTLSVTLLSNTPIS